MHAIITTLVVLVLYNIRVGRGNMMSIKVICRLSCCCSVNVLLTFYKHESLTVQQLCLATR